MSMLDADQNYNKAGNWGQQSVCLFLSLIVPYNCHSFEKMKSIEDNLALFTFSPADIIFFYAFIDHYS